MQQVNKFWSVQGAKVSRVQGYVYDTNKVSTFKQAKTVACSSEGQRQWRTEIP
jgi:hypothetical protein